MEGNDNNSDGGSNGTGWTWRPTVKTWILMGAFGLTLVSMTLRACGVKGPRTVLPPVNTGFDPNNEAQKRSANAVRQLSNLANQMKSDQQNSNRDRTNSNHRVTTTR